MKLLLGVCIVVLALFSSAGYAAEGQSVIDTFNGMKGIPAVTMTTNSDGSQDYTVTIQILAIMTSLTLLPAILMMMTSFTRIIIVFSILRQALGLQQAPSNQILIGLSLFLTFFIMTPVLEKVHDEALVPYMDETITSKEAVGLAAKPFRAFMLGQTRETDIDLFFDIRHNILQYIVIVVYLYYILIYKPGFGGLFFSFHTYYMLTNHQNHVFLQNN